MNNLLVIWKISLCYLSK